MVVVEVNCASTSGIGCLATVRPPEGLAKIIASAQNTTARPKTTPVVLEFSLMTFRHTR